MNNIINVVEHNVRKLFFSSFFKAFHCHLDNDMGFIINKYTDKGFYYRVSVINFLKID